MTNSKPSRVVHKFGGTSLANADCFRQVAAIIAERPEAERLIVVSAMSGVTDELVRAVHVAGTRDFAYREIIEAVGIRYRNTITELVSPASAARLNESLDRDLAEVEEVLHVTTVLHGYSRNGLELVSGYGEVWSAQILAAVIAERRPNVAWLDARDVLIVTRNDTGADVVWPASRQRTDAWIEKRGGFRQRSSSRASSRRRPTALPRRSVATAVISARRSSPRCSTREEIHIWTDVDGVMSANPRFVPEAVHARHAVVR